MESAARTHLLPSPKPLGALGRDEMNLAEFPITLLTDRVPKHQKEAVYQDEIYDERSGLTLTRKLTISAGNHGLTTAVDDEVILALIQITKLRNAFTERKVEFTRSELIRMLGWSDAGFNYERIKTSLNRWTSVYLSYENAWRDNRTKTWKTEGFHIIERFELNDSRHAGEQLDLIPSFIVWNEVIFESFQAGYLKPLDYDLCMGLSNSTAKRLYRFLDKRFHHKPDWTFDLKELAHEHIGLSRNYEGQAHLKRKLQPAITELEDIAFLEPLPEGQRYHKQPQGLSVRFVRKSPTLAASAGRALIALQQSALPTAEPEPSPLVAALVQRGMTRATAEELAREYPERIERQVEYFDWRMEKKPGKIAEPGAYLADAVKKDYAAPKGFTSRPDRQKQDDARQARERQEADERRRKQEEEARERADRQAVNAYRESRKPEQMRQLEADALEQADAQWRATYDEAFPEMKKMVLSSIVTQHIKRILDSQQADA